MSGPSYSLDCLMKYQRERVGGRDGLELNGNPPKPLQNPPHMNMNMKMKMKMNNRLVVCAMLRLGFASPKFYRAYSCCGSSEAEVKKGGGRRRRRSNSSKVVVSDSELKQNWLSSLSCPLPLMTRQLEEHNTTSELVIGIDPDVSGALALLKTTHHHNSSSSSSSSFSAQVFDTPHLQVLVGKRVRKRLDAKSMVQLLRTLDAPPGTSAFIEQSIPFPQDGKQGWWCGGFGYGLWIGILVASGFTVVPVPSSIWKSHFDLCGSRSLKDESRNAACSLFPSMASQLTRKKDHGRADALLIAAYGKSRQTKSET
ncbi:hypothetical protein Scep_013667 [Stephania cephalantha]|uniref:Uncharacterized protein n=1 Tax=Stephania cephalantha TaxID=152367 RepID=A0AAP0IZU9_9MAGN